MPLSPMKNPILATTATSVSTMSPSPAHTPMALPMGFTAQLRALQEAQREQAERIEILEQQNAELREYKDNMTTMLDRIKTLEQYNAYLASRRREVVSQLNHLRTLHHEADSKWLR